MMPVRALIDGKMAGARRLHSATGVLEEWRFAWVSGVLRGAAAGRGSAHFPVWDRCRDLLEGPVRLVELLAVQTPLVQAAVGRATRDPLADPPDLELAHPIETRFTPGHCASCVCDPGPDDRVLGDCQEGGKY